MSGSVFERPKGSGHWSYRIPAKDLQSGKYVTIWKGGFRSKDEAEKAKRKAEVKRDEEGFVGAARLTLAGWFDRWIAIKKNGGLEERTAKEYSRLYREYIGPVIGKVRLRDLKRADVRKVTRILEERGVQRTARNTHSLIRNILEGAVEEELLNGNIVVGMPYPKVKTDEPEMPGKEVFVRLLKDSEGTRIGTMVQLVAWTGLREGELTRLQWSDVDLGKATLKVTEAKHHSIGAIPLSAETVKRLVAHKMRQLAQKEAAGVAWKGKLDLVFTNELGEGVPTARIRKDWEKLRAEHGLTFVKFHHLRHLYASLLIETGLHPKAIQKNMRHKSFATTMNVYGHLMAEREASAPSLAEMDELLTGLLSEDS